MDVNALESNPQDPSLALTALYTYGQSSVEAFRLYPYLRKWLYQDIELDTLLGALNTTSLGCIGLTLAAREGNPPPERQWLEIDALRLALMKTALSRGWWQHLCDNPDWKILSRTHIPGGVWETQ